MNKGDRVGVVGPNGSGKSTIFKIILGEMSTDTGELVIECSPRIGFTRQNPEPDTPDETLLEYSMRGIPGLSEMEAEMAELEADLRSWTGLPKRVLAVRVDRPADGRVILAGSGGAPVAEIQVPEGNSLVFVRKTSSAAAAVVKTVTFPNA